MGLISGRQKNLKIRRIRIKFFSALKPDVLSYYSLMGKNDQVFIDMS